MFTTEKKNFIVTSFTDLMLYCFLDQIKHSDIF